MSLDTEIQAKAREAHAGVAATEARMMGRPRTVEEITEALDSFDFGRFITEREAWYRQRRAGTSSAAEHPCAGDAGAPVVEAASDAVAGCVPPVPDPPRPDEVCPDEVEADAAVGVAPMALQVYAEPKGDA